VKYDNTIIIQARVGSTRLPNKVLMPFYKDKSILDIQLESFSTLSYPIVIATTLSPFDDVIEHKYSSEYQVFRGSENDVMSRFLLASSSDYITRVCADNPFIDVKSVEVFLSEVSKGCDYASYKNVDGVPAIKTHWGLFTEVFRRSALTQAFKLTDTLPNKVYYREHVTNFLYENKHLFNICLIDAPNEVFNRQDVRFTIDTARDFESLQGLYHVVESRICDLTHLINATDKDLLLKEKMIESINQFKK
jgi:spore coat polysaccharide biosynthesis protein SpsF